jgi:hypothetical protein
MREAMAELTATMPSLSLDQGALADLALFRSFSGAQPPPGLPRRAADVADTALRVWWLTIIATDLAQRQRIATPEPVRRLRPLARRCLSVAFSSSPLADLTD